MKRLYILVSILVLILSSCLQERMLFYPDKLSETHKYSFSNDFQELSIPVSKNVNLNGLLFRADSSKGVILYLHGNAGSIDTWGRTSDLYTQNNYDLFMLDYRGYGKSEGRIRSEQQLYSDNQMVYDHLRTIYKEENIIVVGYSLGSGFAAKLSADNKPKMLILKAPYYSMVDLSRRYVKIPPFLIRYKIRTDERIPEIACPIVVFHGDKDKVTYTESSLKLQDLFKVTDRLVILKDQKHNGINRNAQYIEELARILE